MTEPSPVGHATDPGAPAASPPATTGPAGPSPQEAALARRRKALKQSARDMILSMVVILAIAAVVVLLLPRPNGVPVQAVNVAGAAQQAAGRLSFTPAVPTTPPGWTPTSAAVRTSSSGVAAWHVGYVTADGGYASLEQAAGAGAAFEDMMDAGGQAVGATTVGGTVWEQRHRDERDLTALIHRGEGVTTVITSKGGGLGPAQTLAAAIPVAQR